MAGGTRRAASSCVEALKTFVETGKSLLDRAGLESGGPGSLEDFIRHKIRIERNDSLLGLIEAGATLYASLEVKNKKEAEELWSRGRGSSDLQDALEDFLQLGVQWDAFLKHLDDELHPSAKTLDPHLKVKRISKDTPLTNARTGEVLTLERYLGKGEKILLVLIRQFSCLLCRLHLKDLEKHQAALEAHPVRVVVVSFGCEEGAKHWLQETGCPYDMMLDPRRELYSALGLGSSLEKVLNFNNMLLYAEYVVADMTFPRGLPSIQDDMFQLGGDFVVDEHGRVLFSHRCQSPIDRPSVRGILDAVEDPKSPCSA